MKSLCFFIIVIYILLSFLSVLADESSHESSSTDAEQNGSETQLDVRGSHSLQEIVNALPITCSTLRSAFKRDGTRRSVGVGTFKEAFVVRLDAHGYEHIVVKVPVTRDETAFATLQIGAAEAYRDHAEAFVRQIHHELDVQMRVRGAAANASTVSFSVEHGPSPWLAAYVGACVDLDEGLPLVAQEGPFLELQVSEQVAVERTHSHDRHDVVPHDWWLQPKSVVGGGFLWEPRLTWSARLLLAMNGFRFHNDMERASLLWCRWSPRQVGVLDARLMPKLFDFELVEPVDDHNRLLGGDKCKRDRDCNHHPHCFVHARDPDPINRCERGTCSGFGYESSVLGWCRVLYVALLSEHVGEASFGADEDEEARQNVLPEMRRTYERCSGAADTRWNGERIYQALSKVWRRYGRAHFEANERRTRDLLAELHRNGV